MLLFSPTLRCTAVMSRTWEGATALERKLVAVRDYISDAREAANIGDGGIYIRITAEGRVGGDFKLEYQVSDTRYGEECISNDFDSAVEEHLRRHVWKEKNQPKLLTHTIGD